MSRRPPFAAVAIAALTAVAACGPASPPAADGSGAPVQTAPAAPAPAPSAIPAQDPNAPYEPPAPGQPGGLPDDRTPISEAPFTPTSAQGAANVMQTYFALIGEKKYDEAWRQWASGGEASNQTLDDFARTFTDTYAQYHGLVGAPGEIEGAAGSLYVEVPVQIYGRKKDGTPFNLLGKATLRRVNNVDGSTAEQRKWHIAAIDAKQTP